MTEKNELITAPETDLEEKKNAFEMVQRQAIALSKSTLLPKEFAGNVSNIMIAIHMAQRTGFDPFTVMQNLNIVHGRPSWSSAFVAAMIASSGRFAPLKLVLSGEGDQRGCHAEAKCLRTGENVAGTRVTVAMAKAEGWWSKNGSKWPTMTDQMLSYRAVSFFARLHIPDLMLGMRDENEAADSKVADLVIDRKNLFKKEEE